MHYHERLLVKICYRVLVKENKKPVSRRHRETSRLVRSLISYARVDVARTLCVRTAVL